MPNSSGELALMEEKTSKLGIEGKSLNLCVTNRLLTVHAGVDKSAVSLETPSTLAQSVCGQKLRQGKLKLNFMDSI